MVGRDLAVRGSDARAVRRRPRRLRRCSRPPPPRTALHLARRHADPRTGRAHRCRSALTAAGDRQKGRAAPALARAALDFASARQQSIAMARKTSFYYSFLVLPADQRRAIIAVWDLCRAVDDAVDEGGSGTMGAASPR